MYGQSGTAAVRGSAADNVIRSTACRQTVTGAAGDDHLVSTAVECHDGERAGGPGRDTCAAEVRRSC